MKSQTLPKKRTKLTQDTILSVFRSFFGRIKGIIICFRDLVTFTNLLSIIDHEKSTAFARSYFRGSNYGRAKAHQFHGYLG